MAVLVPALNDQRNLPPVLPDIRVSVEEIILLPTVVEPADGVEIETFMSVRVLAAGSKVAEVEGHENRRIHGTSHRRTFSRGWSGLRTIARQRRRGAWPRHVTTPPRVLASSETTVAGASAEGREAARRRTWTLRRRGPRRRPVRAA